MKQSNLLSRRFTPVASVRDCELANVLDQGGNQHSLISRQHGLAERDLTAALVHGRHGTGSILAVRPIGEGLLDISVLIAVKTAILYKLDGVTSGANQGDDPGKKRTHTIDIG